MTEEFDEDVVFENSPLFQYLHDLGHTDFEVCPTGSQDEGCGGDGEEAPPLGDSQKRSIALEPAQIKEACLGVGGHLWRLANALWRWSPIGQAATCHSLERELDCVFGQYSVRCILDQDVLLQEDVELIELLDPGLLTLGSPPDGSLGRTAPLPRPGLLASPSLWDVAGLVGLAAVLLGLCSATGGAGSLATMAPWGLALLGWVGVRGTRLWRRARVQRAVHATTSELQALVHDSKALTGVSRKALRLVQETEDVCTVRITFHLSSLLDRVSAANSFSRAGLGVEPQGQQLIGLRKALYRALRTAFRASRRATCHMLKSYPSRIDNVTNYVSAVPLKELGLGLGVEHVGDEQAQELTDDYSLPALKLMFQLWVAQSSECFRRLALLLSSRQQEEQEPVVAATAAGLKPPSAVAAAATPAALHCSVTARSYDFHRYFETTTRSQGSDRAGPARQKCRELNTLHTSIRSLQLHLKALLSEMIILEDDLEKMMVCGEQVATPMSGEGYLELSQRLHNLQPHMQASTTCWEDTVGQVERMLRRTDNAAGLRQCAPAMPHVPTPTPSYPLILDRDTVPEELEWEAYVSDSDSEEDHRGSWCDMLSPEERDRQRREREESRRVLSELKAVLGFRASEGERLKWKQLLFNDQAATTPLNREDSPGAPSSAGPLEALEGTDGAVAPDTASNHNHKDDGTEEDEEEAEEEEEEEEEEEKEREEGRAAEAGSDGKPVTEFSCGLDKTAAEEEEEGEERQTRHVEGAGGSELYQYDGLPDGEAAGGGGEGEVPDCLLKPRITALSTMDRLTELHGAEALSISSSLAAQVAARSHALVHMEEQTFGDDDDEDEGEYGDSNDAVHVVLPCATLTESVWTLPWTHGEGRAPVLAAIMAAVVQEQVLVQNLDQDQEEDRVPNGEVVEKEEEKEEKEEGAGETTKKKKKKKKKSSKSASNTATGKTRKSGVVWGGLGVLLVWGGGGGLVVLLVWGGLEGPTGLG
ncbi:Vezatin [Merluccius polli]|uniref:Vezatin n=1 Tax=Merluccius polli TaxID=89951 RepID=A0AA47NXT9_MERPO|nr:Vezatin [Merluccius polli]